MLSWFLSFKPFRPSSNNSLLFSKSPCVKEKDYGWCTRCCITGGMIPSAWNRLLAFRFAQKIARAEMSEFTIPKSPICKQELPLERIMEGCWCSASNWVMNDWKASTLWIGQFSNLCNYAQYHSEPIVKILQKTLSLKIWIIASYNARHLITKHSRPTKEVEKENIVVKTTCFPKSRITH